MFTMRNAIKMDDHAALQTPGVSDLPLSGDGKSIAESLLFHHCNAEEGFIDRFGVAGLFNVHEEKPSADGKLDPSSRLSTGLEAALTDFATIGKSTQKQFKREGMVNQEVLDRVKRPSSLQFDGAANVQRAGRLSIGKGTFGTGTEAPDLVRDEMHELATLITGCLWREPDCQAVRHHWVGQKEEPCQADPALGPVRKQVDPISAQAAGAARQARRQLETGVEISILQRRQKND